MSDAAQVLPLRRIGSRVNRKLNLVIPVDTAGGALYVHSIPISREVFERYWLPISKAFAGIYGQGLSVMAGPRVAALMLKKVSEEAGLWEGPDGVEKGLMNEIRRLTNVAVPNRVNGGWEVVPYDDVVRQKRLDPDDLSEIENALVFFICASSMHREAEIQNILTGMSLLWGAQTTSSSCTEYANSLPTSTVIDSSGETAPISSVPS